MNEVAVISLSVAQEVGAKPGQVAVAWVKAKGVLPIAPFVWRQVRVASVSPSFESPIFLDGHYEV
jgi:diketogulonate reductase-like aldo/keto reductase